MRAHACEQTAFERMKRGGSFVGFSAVGGLESGKGINMLRVQCGDVNLNTHLNTLLAMRYIHDTVKPLADTMRYDSRLLAMQCGFRNNLIAVWLHTQLQFGLRQFNSWPHGGAVVSDSE